MPLLQQQALDELIERFLPTGQEIQGIEELFLKVEEAWWYYLDHYLSPLDRKPNLKEFSRAIVPRQTLLPITDFDCAFQMFQEFQGRVPKCGLFFLDKTLTHCIAVTEKGSGKVGIPKGKCLPNELPVDCCKREFEEEIGFKLNLVPQYLISVKSEREFIVFVFASQMEASDTIFEQKNDEIQLIRWLPLNLFQNGWTANDPRHGKIKFNGSCHPSIVGALMRWISNYTLRKSELSGTV